MGKILEWLLKEECPEENFNVARGIYVDEKTRKSFDVIRPNLTKVIGLGVGLGLSLAGLAYFAYVLR